MPLRTNKDRTTLVILNLPHPMNALSSVPAPGCHCLDPEGRGHPPASPKAAR